MGAPDESVRGGSVKKINNIPTAKTLRRIARRLKSVAEQMRQLGADMDYYGGFGKLGERGREMIGAARMAKGWCFHVEQIAGEMEPPTKRKNLVARVGDAEIKRLTPDGAGSIIGPSSRNR